MFSRILVCSDGSEQAIEAAKNAVELARRFDAQLILLNVYDPSVVPAATMGVPSGALQIAINAGRYAEETQKAIEEETSQVFQEAGITYTMRRERGHPVDRIVSVAQEEKVDLIVLGSRGLGGFDRLLLGSVSEGVLHHAHCPVLIVR